MGRRLFKCVALLLCMAMLLCQLPQLPVFAASSYPNTHVNTGNQAADIVAVAVTQAGYCEGSLSGNPPMPARTITKSSDSGTITTLIISVLRELHGVLPLFPGVRIRQVFPPVWYIIMLTVLTV